ncbi:hypothetical protein BH20VER1_BH20VER1_27280 [soil metagenome]|jgi:membrane protease YdiL (CAAX protease family)
MAAGLMPALEAVFNALFLVGGIYIYIALMRQIASRRAAEGVPEEDETGRFGLPEMVVALCLGGLFLANALAASSREGKMIIQTGYLVGNALLSLALLLCIAAFLHFRGISVNRHGGLGKLGFWRTLMTSFVLLFAAYPLIFLADLLTQRILGGPSSKQGIVELFTDLQTLEQRVLIIVLAVAIAPLVEEFIFRFFLYGVLKRYGGRIVGVLVNAALFSVVHAHLPSAVPLFALGICFTLAYEWSGSILVPMTMHALFNAMTLTALAFPELVQP